MNDMTPNASKKRSYALPIAIGVVAIAVGGFLASRAGIDKALVKEQVDGFIASAQAKAKDSGRNLTITYKDIEVAGGFTDRHAILLEPVVTVRPMQPDSTASSESHNTDTLRVTTNELTIYPEASDLSSLRIEAPQPLKFTDAGTPEKLLLTVTSATPPSVTVGRRQLGDVEYSDVAYRSPSQMEFKYLKETQATGEEDKTPNLTPLYETINLAMAQGSGFKASMAQDKSGLGSASIDIADLVITPSQAPESALKAPKISGEWVNQRNEKKRNEVKALLSVGPITSANAALPYQPVSIELDASFNGTIPNTPDAIAAADTDPSVLTIKTLKIATKDSTLSASADFSATATDTVPVGKANISLTNLPYVLDEWRKAGVLSDKSEPMVAALLQKITGKPLADIKDLDVAIERPKDGQFKVGSSTFEELFAVMLSQAMNKQAPAAGASDESEPSHVPQLPPADKPKAAPIEVPNHGDRG